MKDFISKVVAGGLFGVFFLICGMLLSPFWLLVAVVGALLQIYNWKEVLKIWWGLTTLEWFWVPPRKNYN